MPGEWITAVDQPGVLPDSARRYDYGAIRISCRVGDVTGAFGFTSTNDGDLIGTQVHGSGYPLISPSGVDHNTSMWTGSGSFVASGNAGVLRYDVDTTAGQSGMPLWQTQNIPIDCPTPCVVGIHSAGIDPADNVTPNYGTRILPQVLSDLAVWKNYSHPYQIRIPVLIKDSVPVK